MDSTDTKQIVKNAWKAFASHDPEQIAAVFTDDAQWLAPPGNATAKALGHTEHVLDRKTIVHFMAHEFTTLFVSNVELTFTRPGRRRNYGSAGAPAAGDAGERQALRQRLLLRHRNARRPHLPHARIHGHAARLQLHLRRFAELSRAA